MTTILYKKLNYIKYYNKIIQQNTYMKVIQSIIDELINDVHVKILQNEMYYNNEIIFQYERLIRDLNLI